MENVKEKLIEGFAKEVKTVVDYKAIKQLRNTLSTTNFKLNCFDPVKDIYTISYKSLITRVDYKDIATILMEIDNKFETYKKEIIIEIQEEDYNSLIELIK